MTDTTYTYPADGRGEPVSGMTAREVAEARLTHDGHTYELRRNGRAYWELFTSDGSINSASGAGAMRRAYDGHSRAWALKGR